MSSINVGSMTVGMNVDLTAFQTGMQKATDLARSGGANVSAEMKRTASEGAESFRLIDEAIGLHFSRPITKLLTQEFPGLAEGLKSVLGVGLTAGVAIGAFEFVAQGIERVTAAIDKAKKAEEDYQKSTEKLQSVLEHYNDLATLNPEQIQTIEEARKRIDDVSQALETQAKALAEANSMWNKFLVIVGDVVHKQFSLNSTLHIEEINAELPELQKKLDALAHADPLDKTGQQAKLLKDYIRQSNDELRQMKDNSDSAAKSLLNYIADYTKIVSSIPTIGGGAFGSSPSLVAKTITPDVLAARKQSIDAAQTLLDSISKPLPSKPQSGSQTDNDRGERAIEKLKAETAAQIALAGAVNQTVAAQRLQQASGEADQIIASILQSAHGKLTAELQKEIGSIHALTVERDLAKDIVSVSQEMQKQTEEIQRNISASREMADAYLKGGDAIEDAKIDQRLAPEIQKLTELEQKYDLAKKAADDYAAASKRLGTAAGPLPGLNIPAADLDKMKAAIDHQKSVLNDQRADLKTADLAAYQLEIDKTADSLREEQPYLDALNDSYLQGAEAIRKAQVQLALFHWEQAHPGQSVPEAKATLANPASTDAEKQAAQQRLNQIAEVNAQLDQQSINAQRSADARAAAEYSVGKAYEDQLQKLGRIREVIQQNGGDTLLIDAAIQDATDRYLKQWDDATFKVGTFGDKFKAVMDEVVLQGQHAGEEMARSWVSAIGQVNDELAKLATGQKADFKHVVQGLAEQQTKGQLQKFEGSIAAHYGIKVPGLEGKPDGTASNPLHVAVVRAAAVGAIPEGGKPTLAGLSENPFGAIKNLFGGTSAAGIGLPDGTQNNPIYVAFSSSLLSTAGTQGGLNFGDLGKLFSGKDSGVDTSGLTSFFAGFGGFRAKGGDVMPGMDYIVGEQGAELLRIPAAGHITSNADMRSIGGSTDNSRTTNVTQKFYGNQDKDSMGRTMRQNLNRILRHIR